MRIATLGNAALIHTQNWVEYFRGRGHEVRVWSLEPGPQALGAHPLPVWPLPGALRYPLAAGAARAAIRAFAPDVVNAHFVPNYGVIGRLVGWRPLVVTPWGSDLDRFRARSAREPELMLSTRMHEPVYDLPTVLRGAHRVLESRPGA